jgi:hypothetical protein
MAERITPQTIIQRAFLVLLLKKWIKLNRKRVVHIYRPKRFSVMKERLKAPSSLFGWKSARHQGY